MKNISREYLVSIRKAIILGFVIFLFSGVSAQVPVKEEAPPLRERIFFGGNFSLQIGTYTNIEVSPVIGLWVRPRIAIALGPDYKFYKDPYENTNIFGGRAYVQYVVIQDLNKFLPLGKGTGIFLHLEDEMLSLDSHILNITSSPRRFAINTVLAGAGLSQQIGRRAAVNLMILWPVNESGPELPFQLYSSPEIRIGFVF